MNVLMELTDMIFIHFCELILMFVSCDMCLIFKNGPEIMRTNFQHNLAIFRHPE